VPGTQPPVDFHRSPGRAALNAVELLPWQRGAGAVMPAVQAFRGSGDVNAAISAARATFRGRGPVERWLIPKLQAARTAGLANPHLVTRAVTRYLAPVPFPESRYGVPNATVRQLELGVDRGLLFSGGADWLKQQAEKPMQYEIAQAKKARQQRQLRDAARRAGVAPYQP
jgi:hypothetical protein